MKMKSTFTAAVTAAATLFTANAAMSETIIQGGEARITLTADLMSLGLGAGRWRANADGQPEYYNYVRSSPGYKYKYLRYDRNTGATTEREWTASERSGSTYVSPTAAKLKLASSTLYLYATDSNGDEIKTFAPSVWIAPQRSSNEGYELFSTELRNINFVPTVNPLVWKDYKNPTATYTLTQAQVDLLTEQADDLRLCCAHTLGNLEIDTALMTIDGLIDGVAERDINFDGVINEKDEFHLFDMVDSGVAGVYNLALTSTMAQYLNYGFTPAAFANASDFIAKWSGPQNGLSFSGGDVIGKISYSYTSGPAPVPLPAGLPLLLGGLGVVGLVKRRSARKAA